MNRYTLHGAEYIAHDDRLYTPAETTHGLADIEHGLYLYKGDLVRIEHAPLIDNVKIDPAPHDAQTHYYVAEDDFAEATPLDLVLADDEQACPNCGEKLGETDDGETYCIHCGRGLDT